MIGRRSGEATRISSSFFEELKRRNVIRVAVLYLVASWLLLQVTDVLSSLLPVPEWAGSLVVMLLILGFLPAMIFSWVYEMTPEGLKKEKDIDRSQSITPETGHKINVLIIVLLVLAIGGLIADRLMPETATVAETPLIEETELSEATPDRSIAVLPFVNMSDDASNEFFSDGISEELLNLLAKIPELHVTSRSSAFAFKGEKIDIPEVAQKLNVAHVLEGSVRKAGNQVRITAQLIEARSDKHLWSETYDRKLDDVFAVQDEIAAEVVTQLKITLLGEVPTIEETDPEAYSLYLQARHARYQRTPESYEKAVALFEQALAIVPDYAAAWTGLGEVYAIQSGSGLRPREEGFRLADEAAEKALAIAPDYAPVHALLAFLANSRNDPISAARHYERALELEPTNVEILIQAAVKLRELGRLDESIRILDYVVARDPVNPSGFTSQATLYLYTGRLDEAIASYRKALSLSPGVGQAHSLIGYALLLKGEPEAGLAEIEKDPSVWRLIGLPMAYHALGQTAESDAALAELIEKWEQDAAYNIAYVFAYRGETDLAFEWLDKAVLYNDPGLIDIATTPEFDNIHGDPRWLPFLESIGMAPEQLAAIEFEVAIPD
ncbi:MAG: tetratricopeptide repeat protein [Gammaproteobacteria bacterium]|nr:MAG: tetratricopeptide repeat protein [Gammaproteobacteria bacterium]